MSSMHQLSGNLLAYQGLRKIAVDFFGSLEATFDGSRIGAYPLLSFVVQDDGVTNPRLTVTLGGHKVEVFCFVTVLEGTPWGVLDAALVDDSVPGAHRVLAVFFDRYGYVYDKPGGEPWSSDLSEWRMKVAWLSKVQGAIYGHLNARLVA